MIPDGLLKCANILKFVVAMLTKPKKYIYLGQSHCKRYDIEKFWTQNFQTYPQPKVTKHNSALFF